MSVTVILNMNSQALIERKTQLKSSRNAELRTCRAKWRAKICSIDLLLRASTSRGANTAPAKSRGASRATVSAYSLEGKANGDRKQGVMEVVQQTLRQNRGFFTAKALVKFINKSQACAVTGRDIRRPLRILRKRGEIRLIERGNGMKPHLYLKS
jgi:hypothetical protein